MDTQQQLKKIHELELMIALEIRRICEKYEIPYFLTAGTLLGAVRHGGFIPWDDDMDIGMLRADYERFTSVCDAEFGDKFYFQTWDNDPDYPFSYGKVRLRQTHFRERFSENCYADDGIFVDVFPFDNVPDRKPARKKQEIAYYLCKRLLWIKKGFGRNMLKNGKKSTSKYILFNGLSKLFCYKWVKAYFNRTQRKYNGKRTEKVVTDGSYTYTKESLPREWVEHLAPIRFEGEEFLSYRDYEAYLIHFYGDYMRLPPPEERNRHQVWEVDFGPYA